MIILFLKNEVEIFKFREDFGVLLATRMTIISIKVAGIVVFLSSERFVVVLWISIVF